MEAGYCLVNMIELGYLTPLEKVVATTHTGFKEWADRKYAAELTLRGDEVADMAMVAFERSSPEYRYAAALAAAKDIDVYLSQVSVRLALTLSAHLNMFMDRSGLDCRLDIGPPRADELIGVQMLHRLAQGLNGRVPTEEELGLAVSHLALGRKERFMAQFQLITDTLTAGTPSTFTTRTIPQIIDDTMAAAPPLEVTFREPIPADFDEVYGEAVRFSKARKAANRPSKRFLERAELKLRKEGKRALRRAYNFFMDHEREEELRVFIRGGDVEVFNKNSDVKFVFKRGQGMDLIERSIEAKTKSGQWRHIDVEIFTKTNVFLAGICVYIQDTPILDQLMALIMMVEAGLEDELIELGNLKHFNQEVVFEELALKSPVLNHKLSQLKARYRNLSGLTTTTTLVNNYTRFINTTSTYVNSWIEQTPGTFSTTTINTFDSTFTNIGLPGVTYQVLLDQASLYNTQLELEIA